MRKFIFTTILSMAVITASFHAQVKRFVVPERKTSKTINLTISTTNNYSSHAYKHCEAKLDYTVIKVRGRQTDTIEQKQFPQFKLKELSSFAQTFDENIKIPDVADRSEQIIISYTVTYSSKGSVLKVEHEKQMPVGVWAGSLSIHI